MTHSIKDDISATDISKPYPAQIGLFYTQNKYYTYFAISYCVIALFVLRYNHTNKGELFMIDLKSLVEQAMKEKGITTNLQLQALTGLTYRQVTPVLKGYPTAKIALVEKVLHALGYQLKAVKL